MRRRMFVRLAVLTATAMGVSARPAWSQSGGASQAPMVDPKDPLAVQLGYVEDVSKVNKAKYPQYQAGQKCSNCQLYIGKGAVAPCTVFGDKRVPAEGWCSAWAKKVS